MEADLLAGFADQIDELTEVIREQNRAPQDGDGGGGGNDGGVLLPRWLVIMLVGAVLSSAGAGFWAGVRLGNRVDFIERTMATKNGDAQLEARMRAYHDDRTPPPVVNRRLDEIERRLNNQSDRVLRLEQNGGN